MSSNYVTDFNYVLSVIRLKYGRSVFVDGDCHTLAVALFEENNCCGRLVAVMCGPRTDSDSVDVSVDPQYVHMIYESPDGESWDIDGKSAYSRWLNKGGDETIPRAYLSEVPYCGHQLWLMENYGCIDVLLCNALRLLVNSSLSLESGACRGIVVDSPKSLLDKAYEEHLSSGDTPLDREQWEAENSYVVLSGHTFYMDQESGIVDSEAGWLVSHGQISDSLIAVELCSDGEWSEVPPSFGLSL